jgi:hypothetical protein
MLVCLAMVTQSKGGTWLFGVEVKHKDTEWNKSEMQWLKH